MNIPITLKDEKQRTCGSCTKCCEGTLGAIINGNLMAKGRPCHFVQVNKGCTIYDDRPINPCQEYKCAWVKDFTFPEWMKPNEINTIIDYRVISTIPYINVEEAGAKLDSKVLSWVVTHALTTSQNLRWVVEGGANFMGSKEFIEATKDGKL